MSPNTPTTDPIEPPTDVPEIQRGDWLTLSAPDPVTEYLTVHHWDRLQSPVSWQVARLSRAAHVYRETSTGWAVVVKFYAVKTGDKAERYASREFECTQRAQAAGLGEGDVRAVRPLATWGGALFLEYVDGLTLEDIIAVRRSRPGTLTPSLERVAQLLATLHTHGAQPDPSTSSGQSVRPDFQSSTAYARKLVRHLVRWGILESDPIVRDGLLRSIDRWAAYSGMEEFAPALTHGDATTSNFIFPWDVREPPPAPPDRAGGSNDGGVVAIDWERLYVADPAADLGRLMAEVSHSIKQHGGSVAEAVPVVQRLADAYCRASPACVDAEALLERARFYQASSTLRIARNGWVSRLDRMALVAQALVLLI